MGIIRNVWVNGGSVAFNLPMRWVKFVEDRYGQELKRVDLEVRGETLTIRPYFESNEEEGGGG